MDKDELLKTLLNFRTKTYVAGTGKVKAAFDGSVQYEHQEGNWSYRDIYFIGSGIFPGLETLSYKGKPVWSMSYYGNFSSMTEEQADTMLRKALTDTWETTRIYNHVEKNFGDFTYICDGDGDIDELSGTEEILVDGKQVYFFYYAGGYIGD